MEERKLALKESKRMQVKKECLQYQIMICICINIHYICNKNINLSTALSRDANKFDKTE
jgi:hypothetical protein